MKLLNNLVSFLLELAMLGALSYWGFHAGSSVPLKWLLGIGVPIAVIVFWGFCMAPTSDYRLPWPWVPIVSLVLFLAAALALYASHARSAALALAVVAIVNVALVLIWHQN